MCLVRERRFGVWQKSGRNALGSRRSRLSTWQSECPFPDSDEQRPVGWVRFPCVALVDECEPRSAQRLSATYFGIRCLSRIAPVMRFTAVSDLADQCNTRSARAWAQMNARAKPECVYVPSELPVAVLQAERLHLAPSFSPAISEVTVSHHHPCWR